MEFQTVAGPIDSPLSMAHQAHMREVAATERSPEDVVTGVLRISVGGIIKSMPTLKIKQIPEWSAILDAKTPSATATADPAEGFTLVAKVTLSGLLDLVVAYDRTGALGGREWLEEHADPMELREAALAMAGNAFPFGEGAGVVGRMLMDQIKQAVAPSPPPKSTNGRSRSGASTRKRSALVSIPSS
jgi:hypothetical protein